MSGSGRDAWTDARERARDEVRAAFAPRARVCRRCGNEEVTAARTCSRCGASYVERADPGMSPRARRRLTAGAVVAVILLGVAAAVIVPIVQHQKRVSDARDRADARAALVRERRRLALDQRLHVARSPASRRVAVVRRTLEAAVTADARARVRTGSLQGPILRTECTPFRGAGGPPVGRYTCEAVNNSIVRTPGAAPAGTLGYPFWARVDFRHRRLAWCKVNPKAGEGSATPGAAALDVPLPRGCDIAR